MKDLTKGWLIMWCIVSICITFIILGCVSLTYYNNIHMAVLGYEQGTVIGSSLLVWKKSKN